MANDLALFDAVKALQITSDADYSRAVDLRETIRAGIAQVKASQDPLCAAAHKARQAATTERARLLAPWEEALKAVDRPILAYQQEQERAKQALLETERRRVAEEAARLEAQAGQMEETGDFEGARESYLAADAQQVALQQSERDLRAVPQAPVAFRTKYSARVVDAQLVPREYLVVDEPKLNAMARALKDDFCVPGVELVKERTVAGRG